MKTFLALLGAILGGFCALKAAPPPWWTGGSSTIIDSNATAQNYSPANLGQLKLVAKRAKAYLDLQLAAFGGAGSEIDALVASFELPEDASEEERQALRDRNYAPINLGQLKAVGKPFYERLLSLGYDTRQNLIQHGYPTSWTFDYPWNVGTPVQENYAVANLGQLKMVFSFDITGDTDSDGMSDLWELQYFGRLDDPDGAPNADPDGDGLNNLQEFRAGTGPLAFDSDTDSDGMPDFWELHNGLNMWNPVDGTLDFDGDGASNFAEFLAGTDPLFNSAAPPATTIPTAPGNVYAREIPSEGYVVTWDDRSTNEDFFVVYLNVTGGTRIQLARSPSTQTFVFIPLGVIGTVGGQPPVSVAAVNAAGESSATAAGAELIPLPPQPVGLNAERLDRSQVRLTWGGSINPNEETFVVFRAVNDQPWVTLASFVSQHEFLDSAADAGTDIRYKVAVRGYYVPFPPLYGPPSEEIRVHWLKVTLRAGATAFGPDPDIEPIGLFSVDGFFPPNYTYSDSHPNPEPTDQSVPGPYPLHHDVGPLIRESEWEFYNEKPGYLPRGVLFNTGTYIQTFHAYHHPVTVIEAFRNRENSTQDETVGPSTGFIPPLYEIWLPPNGQLKVGDSAFGFYDARIKGAKITNFAEEGFDDMSNPLWQMVPSGDVRKLKFKIDPPDAPNPGVMFGLYGDDNLTFSPDAIPPGVTDSVVSDQGSSERDVRTDLACLRSAIRFDVRTPRRLSVKFYRVHCYGRPTPPDITPEIATQIQNRLNAIYEPQANIQFDVYRESVPLEFTINNDTDRDGFCVLNLDDPEQSEGGFAERANTPLSDPDLTFYLWSPGAFAVREGGLTTITDKAPQGAVSVSIPGRFAFIDMVNADQIAHEIGHLLGLQHTFANTGHEYQTHSTPDNWRDRLMGYDRTGKNRLIKMERDIICAQADALKSRP